MESILYHLKVMLLAALTSIGGVALGLLLGWLIVNPAYPAVRVDSAIVLLADMSSSMDDGEREIVRTSHAQAIVSGEVLDAIRSGAYQQTAFAYVEYSSNAVVAVDWVIVDSPQSAQAFADRILAQDRPRPNGDMTALGEALAVAVTLFDRLPYEPLFRTVDVAGDGSSNRGAHPSVPRQQLLDMGATINGLPMTLRPAGDGLPEYFEREIMGGPRAFSIELRDMADMPMLVRRKLVMEIGAAMSSRRNS